MKHLAQFVSEHLTDDTSKLILNRSKWPDIDIDLAVNCIESRRKLRNKIPEWADNSELVFPVRLSAEQCSSSATGRFKAGLAERIVLICRGNSNGLRIADLTGGLGADTWFFSGIAHKVLYNEMQEILCRTAEYNFHILGADNITVSNIEVNDTNAAALLGEFAPDIIYLDPARRGECGRKVFLLEDCRPDIIGLKDVLFSHCRNILVKLSPMADISMLHDRLGRNCREIYTVASDGECKELLVWMDREWDGEYTVNAVELRKDGLPGVFSFLPSEERNAVPGYASGLIGCEKHDEELFLFEPGKALMKAGGFNIIGRRFGIEKIGRSTHYYIISGTSAAEELKRLGKTYRITRCASLDKRSIRDIGSSCRRAEVTARNLPMDTETLRKKLGVSSGDDTHIFGLKSDNEGNLLLCTQRVF